mgnify:CR=1 FL=1
MLLLPHNATEEDIKQRYHKLSMMVHPDKVADPRARDAFIEVRAVVVHSTSSSDILFLFFFGISYPRFR